MSEAVDTRVVEAKFDSSDFERGVDRTVKKLDELKQSLDLEKTGESVASLASKTSSALDKIENRITTFTGMLKQKLLGGLADEIVGVFFKIKSGFESLVTSLSTQQVGSGMSRYVEMMTSVRTMVFSGVDQSAAYATIERLGVYADQTSYSLDALSSTMSKFRTAGADLATAERMVIGLSNAAASMGVNAQDAQRAYLNLQQAYSKGYMMQNDWISFESLPMVGDKFNQKILDAAVAVGTLEKQLDGTYKTTKKVDKMVQTSGAAASGITAQNLGSKLASKWFNKQVMEEVFGSSYYFNIDDEDASDIISDLKKKEKEVKKDAKERYQAANTEKAELDKLKEDKKISEAEYENRLKEVLVSHGINVDTKNFNYDAIYEDLFQTEIDAVAKELYDKKKAKLDESFKEGTLTVEQYNAALKDLEKSTSLTVFGWEAFRAGQEARSFTDVLNTLKDAISRGWAKSFELIFGQLDKAAEFFTWLTETKLAEAIYSIGSFRNAVLGIWSGGDDNSGRQNIIMGLKALDDLLGRLLGRFAIFSDDEDKVNAATTEWGERLMQFSKNFYDFANSLNDWFTDERIDKIHDFFAAIGDLLSTIFKVLGKVVNFATQVFAKLTPIFGKVLEVITTIITRVNEHIESKGLKSLEDMFNDILTAITPLIDPLSNIVGFIGDIAGFFAELSIDTALINLDFFKEILEFIIELFTKKSTDDLENGTGVLERLKNAIIGIGEACRTAVSFVSGFTHNLLEDLRVIFGLRAKGEDEEYFSSLKNYFKTDETVKAIKKYIKSIPQKLGNLVKNVWNKIRDVLFGKHVRVQLTDLSGKTYEEKTVWIKSTFVKWFEKTIKAILDWVANDFPNKIKEIWNSILEFFTGKKITGVQYDPVNHKFTEYTDIIKTGFSKWLDDAIASVKNWIKNIPTKIKSLWNSVMTIIFGRYAEPDEVNPETGEAYPPNKRIGTAFSKWLESIPVNIWNWIKGLPTKISKIWNTVIDLVFGKKSAALTGMVTAANGVSGNDEETPNGHIAAMRVGTAFSRWLEALPGKVVAFIKDIPTKIKNIWNSLLDLVFGKKSSFYTGLVMAANGVSGDDEETPNGHIAAMRVGTAFSRWLEELPGKVIAFIKDIPTKIKNIWNSLLDLVFGKKIYTLSSFAISSVGNGTSSEDEMPNGEIAMIRIGTAFSRWLESLPGKVITFIKDLPNKVRNLWNTIIEFIFGKKLSASGIGASMIANVTNDSDSGTIGGNMTIRVKQGFAEWLDNTITKVKEWIPEAKEAIKSLWNMVLGAIFGVKETESKDVKWDNNYYQELLQKNPVDAEEYKEWYDSQKDPILDAATEFVNSLGIDIAGIISRLPTIMMNGISFKVDFIDSLFGKVTAWLDGINSGSVAEGAPTLESKIEDILAYIAGDEGVDTLSPFTKSVIDLGKNLYDTITQTIPSFLSSAWTTLSNYSGELWNAIVNIFNLDEKFSSTELNDRAKEIGDRIAEIIKGIPSVIRAAVGNIKDLFDYDPYEEAKDQITKAFSDENGNIIDRKGYNNALKEARKLLENSPKESGIVHAVKEIGLAIKDAFIEIGPDILDGINSVFTWIGDEFYKVTTFLNESHEKGLTIGEAIEEKLKEENDPQKMAIWEAIKSIGETIKHIILEVIPGFITSAIDEIKLQVPKWISDVFGEDLFGSGSDNGLLSGKGMSVATQEATKNAEVFVRSLAAQTEEVEEATDGLISREEALKKLEEKKKKIEKEIKEDNVVLLGEQLPGLYNKGGNTSDSTDELNEINKQIEKLNSLDETITEVDPSEYGLAKKTVEKSGNLLDSLLGVFDSITAWDDTAKLAATVIAITLLVHELKDLFTITDEVESFGYTAKWTGIAVALAGITGIIGYVTYLASLEDQTRIGNVEAMFDKIVAMIEKIGEVLQTIAWIKLGTTGLDMVTSIFNWRSAKNAAKAATGGASLAQSLFTGFATTLAKFGLVAAAGDTIGSSIESLFSSISDTFLIITSAVDELMSYIGPSIEKLISFKDDIGTAISVLEDVAELVGTFYHVLDVKVVALEVPRHDSGTSMLTEEGYVTAFETLESGFVEDVENRIAAISRITMLMNNLSSSLKTLQEVENPSEQIGKMLEVVKSDDFAALMELLSTVIFEKLDNIMPDYWDWGPLTSNFDANSVSLGFQVLGDALNILGEGIKNLNEDSVKNLDGVLTCIERIANSFGDAGMPGVFTRIFTGDSRLSEFGREIKFFGLRIKDFFSYVKELPGTEGDAEYERTQRAIGLIIQVAKGLAEASSYLVENATSEEYLSDFGSNLEGYGSNIGAFIRQVNANMGEEIDLDRVQMIALGVTALAELAKGLGELNYNSGSADTIKTVFHEFMGAITEELAKPENDFFTIGLEIGKNINLGLAQSIQAGNTESIITELVDLIKGNEILKALSEAAGTDFENPQITPVLHIDQDFVDKANEMRRMLAIDGGANIEMGANGQWAIPTTSLDLANSITFPIQHDYTARLETIIRKIGDVQTTTAGLATVISRMHFDVDGKSFANVMGPYIDKYLGNEKVTYKRGGDNNP